MIDFDYRMEDPYFWRRNNQENPTTLKAPIYMRIEIDGYERSEFATGVKATKAEWNSTIGRLQVTQGMKKQQIKEIDESNGKLIEYAKKAHRIYTTYKSQGGELSPADLREFLRGNRIKKEKDRTIIGVLEQLYTDLSNKGRQPNTLLTFRHTVKTLTAYLAQIKRPKLLAQDIDRVWVRDFERWCIEHQWNSRTIRTHISVISRAIDLAVDEGLAASNRVSGYKYLSEVKQNVKRRLTLEELTRLRNYVFEQQTLQKVAHLFIFCCYTGLSFADYTRFARTPKEFIVYKVNSQGKKVKGIGMQRQKMLYTTQEFWVPFFPEATVIMVFYEERGRKLPIYEHSYVNKKLKVIAHILQLSLSDLKHKDARSTFSQWTRDKFGRELSAGMAGHLESTADKAYSSTTPERIVEQLTILGAKLTDN
jgi:Phage integrase SAM-like domain